MKKPQGLSWVLVLGGLAIAGFAAGSLLPRAIPLSGADAARASGASYNITTDEIQYPFVPYGTATAPDASQAGVRYTAQWVTDDYPGPAPCVLVLRDAEGEVVGQKEFQLDSLTRTFESNMEPVGVSAPPTTASASCASGEYVDSANYSFELISVEPDGSARSRLTFLARWTTDVSPGARECNLQVQLRNGRTLQMGPFNAYLGTNGEEMDLSVAAEQKAIVDAAISCKSVRE
jgi:hypothetical protein